MPEGGLEPPLVISPPDFESGASANSATPATTGKTYTFKIFLCQLKSQSNNE